MKKISEALDGFFESFGLTDENNYLGFIGAWPKIAGETLACHSRPSDIRGTALIVCVDHPGWMTRLQFAEKAIITKIKKDFPQLGINTLGFKLVEKLPKPEPIAPRETEVDKKVENMGTNSEQSVDNPGYEFKSGEELENASQTSPKEFLLAMQKLKRAIGEKTRNDR